MHTRVSSGTYYSWAMLVPGRSDGPACGRPHMLLHPMRPASPIASFFENTHLLLVRLRPTPPPRAASHTSSCLASCMREREHNAHTPMRERAQHTCPNARETREGSQRACTGPMRERKREGAQRACICVEPATCSTKGSHAWWCRAPWRSACLPTSQSAWGSNTCCNILK
jgi:hypothetical protein